MILTREEHLLHMNACALSHRAGRMDDDDFEKRIEACENRYIEQLGEPSGWVDAGWVEA